MIEQFGGASPAAAFAQQVEDSIFGLTSEEIERYPVGVVTVDRQGIVLRYNRAESVLARRSPIDVVGRHFFIDIAPCAAVREFQGRFEEFARSYEAGAERFDFTFAFGWGKQDVTITLLRRANFDEIMIVIRIRSMRRPAATPVPGSQIVDPVAPALPPDDPTLVGYWIDEADGVSFWSDDLYRLVGITPTLEVPQAGYTAYVHPEDAERVRSLLATAHADGSGFHIDHRLVGIDGHVRLVRLQGRVECDPSGARKRTLGTVIDLEARRANAQRWWRAAHFDALTRLPNRVLFMQRLEVALAGESEPFALLFLDLDRFKLVNDTAGHAVGDQLLRLVASRLVSSVGASTTVARLNGDEFVAIVPGVEHASAAAEIAELMIQALSLPFVIDEHQHFVTTSIGIAMWPRDGDDPETLLQAADFAMYHAKQHGPNQYLFYADDIREGTQRSTQRENELRAAVSAGDFSLDYQPIRDAQSTALCAVEALVRWRHPTLGIVSPGDFIPLAEKTGLIVPLGFWVLRAACAQMRAWRDAGKSVPLMTVNVSTAQVKSRRFAESVARLLEEFALEPSTLEIEITESLIVSGFEETLQSLADLKLLGVRISIDDFGTGYSSLSYLKYLPVDTLKLDRSFVMGIGTERLDDAIAATIIALAKSMELTVIAEGVETQTQLDGLRKLGCAQIQGFLLGRPMAPAQIAELCSEIATDPLS